MAHSELLERLQQGIAPPLKNQIWILKGGKYQEWRALCGCVGTPSFTFVYLNIPDLDEGNMYKTPLCFSAIFPLVPWHCFLKSVHLKPGRLQDKRPKWSENCTVPSVDEGHGLREIQQETQFFLIKLCFFFPLFRQSKDGHFTINRCFCFGFSCDFPSALDSGTVVDILGKHFWN